MFKTTLCKKTKLLYVPYRGKKSTYKIVTETMNNEKYKTNFLVLLS
jgi:hypothetical protein